MNCNRNDDHPASLFLHSIEDCKLDQLVDEYTHLKPNCKPSLIDLILTNNKEVSNNPAFLPRPEKKSTEKKVQSLDTTIFYIYKCKGVIHISADAKKAHFGTPPPS